MRQWGDTKDHTYYITEFGSLRRKKDETIADFSKRFNKMYSRIPAEIKPTETSAKLTYANAFDHEFSLLLRERRPIYLLNMQDAALEVESNILASNRLKKETARQLYDRKGKRGRWIAKIMEYDVEIRPTKLVKGQGLAKLLAESNC